jgi:hypothetical protein
MKHLKFFESFYYGNKEKVDQLLSVWNVDPEDLEDLFIWFSDMGCQVEIRTNLMNHVSDRTLTRKSIWVAIQNIKDFNSQELMEEMEKVIIGLPKLGLQSASPVRYEESNMIVFIMWNKP